MHQADSTKDSVFLSVEKIIDIIRTLRNDLAKEFLKDEVLCEHYKQSFKKEISTVKKEFLKRDLKDLLIQPVDLVHYAGLINHIRETGAASLTIQNSDYFYKDINRIFNKYMV